jgi:uncharacterized membrane protein
MASLHTFVELDVLVPVAYRQWLRFEDFPEFMESVEEVRRVDATRLHWRGKLAGKPLEWDTEITEAVPERRLAWRDPANPGTHGVVLFEPLNEGRTRLTVDVEYQPECAEARIADLFGQATAQLEDDLERFKAFVEARGKYTGGPDPESVSPA